MSTLIVNLPDDLRAAIAGEVARRGVSETAWLEEAVRDKLSAAAQMAYLMERGKRADRAAYDRVLANVPSAPPEPGDERPTSPGPGDATDL